MELGQKNDTAQTKKKKRNQRRLVSGRHVVITNRTHGDVLHPLPADGPFLLFAPGVVPSVSLPHQKRTTDVMRIAINIIII